MTVLIEQKQKGLIKMEIVEVNVTEMITINRSNMLGNYIVIPEAAIVILVIVRMNGLLIRVN